ncbi:MAG: hypothetical protein HYW90_04045 [Candidatus Sungbacteria bacterium]|nr:hypothetical protein [Candidatus Sungbacteria bacterium]
MEIFVLEVTKFISGGNGVKRGYRTCIVAASSKKKVISEAFHRECEEYEKGRRPWFKLYRFDERTGRCLEEVLRFSGLF